jgi:hypothetical protein
MESPSIIELSYLPDTPMDRNSKLSGTSATNFGGGIELLMNDKIKNGQSGKGSSGISDFDDLSKLEFELSELTSDDLKGTYTTETPPRQSEVRFSNIFSENDTMEPSSGIGELPTININSNLGESTAYSSPKDSTMWDGYTKLNASVNPDKLYTNPEATMTKEELLREKFKMLKKIETLERKGVEFTKKYNMESTLSEMTGEYETVMDERSKQSSVKFQGNMLISIVNGIEYLNGKLDYLDIKLDGWSEQVNDNLNDYDDIFGELYDQYKDKTSVSPWVKLLFQIGGSAFMVHLSNTMFKSAMPSMDDIFRQNPDLMKSFQSAAINTMGKTSPGMAGFMNGVTSGMGAPMSGRDPYSTQRASPPQQQSASNYDEYISQTRGGNNSYGVSTTSVHQPPPSYSKPPPNKTPITQYHQQGTSSDPSFGGTSQPQPNRPDMKGPNDINDILSRLKPKNATPPIPPSSQSRPINNQSVGNTQNMNSAQINLNENSTISLSELSEIHSDLNIPKKSRRKPKSDKNTISLSL